MSDDDLRVQSNPLKRISRGPWIAIGISLLLIAGIFVLRHAPPTAKSLYPKCMLFQWTGIHCPGCGGTRAVHALAHFRVYDAIRFNALLVLGLPVFGLCLIRLRQLRRQGTNAFPRFGKVIAAIVIAFFIMRNVPTPKTSPLAPPTPAESADES